MSGKKEEGLDGGGREEPPPNPPKYYGWQDIPEPLRWLLAGLALGISILAFLTWAGDSVDRLGRNSLVGPELLDHPPPDSSSAVPPSAEEGETR